MHLQTKRLPNTKSLAEKFNLTIRTIYRDIKALDQAAILVITVDEKGFTLPDGCNRPPFMFTQSQANALILAEQLVLLYQNPSLIKDYIEAVDKIKAVLRQSNKNKVNLPTERTRSESIVYR